MTTRLTHEVRFMLAGLVVWLTALTDPETQPASSVRMPLSRAHPGLPGIEPLPASVGSNRPARRSPPIPPVPSADRELFQAATNVAAPRTSPDAIAAAVKTPRSPLVWDAEVKEYNAGSGETNAYFAFSLKNTGPAEALVTEVRTSCGCVVATLPEYPWRLRPGTNGLVQVIADLRGKRGLVHKMIYVHTAEHGIQSLTIKVHIPDATPGAGGDRASSAREY